ncbi:MAG: hypothetical protein SNG02_05105 [Rikenellaceae bacterium]
MKTKRLTEARGLGVSMHIWSKKEIENYLIVAEVICRIINAEHKTGVEINTIKAKIESICSELIEETIDLFANEIGHENRGYEVSKSRSEAKKEIQKRTDGAQSYICGKNILAKLAEWVKSEYKVSINKRKVAHAFNAYEIPNEVKSVIDDIENNRSFPPK